MADDMKTTQDNSEGGGAGRGLTRPRRFCFNRETRIVLLEMQNNKDFKFHGIGKVDENGKKTGLVKRTGLSVTDILEAISEAGQMGFIQATNSAEGLPLYGLSPAGRMAII
jgi:hypothetical protein